MPEKNIIESLLNLVRTDYKIISLFGMVFGAILVIYYCSTINFYPSGLSIADTLFFLWVIAIFTFYYSIVVFVFFVASVFWYVILSKPINFFSKLFKSEIRLNINLTKIDKTIVFFFGLMANILIIFVTVVNEGDITLILMGLFIIAFIYALTDRVSGFKNSNLLDDRGYPIRSINNNIKTAKFILFAIIYITPIIVSQVGGEVTVITFNKMGIRQESVNIYIPSNEYKEVFNKYLKSGLISSLNCNELCSLENIDILFTNIGVNTKIETHSLSGNLQMVLPTSSIKLVVKKALNNSSRIKKKDINSEQQEVSPTK